MSAESKSLNKRELFFEKTLKLFHAKGFKATTMRDIAENMGFEVANVYNYIENKDSLLISYVNDIAEEMLTGIKQIEQSSYSNSDKIKAVVAMHVRVSAHKPYEVGLMLDEFRNLDVDNRIYFDGKRAEYKNILQAMLKRGIEVGDFVPTNAAVASHTIMSSVRWLHGWFAKHGQEKVSPVEMEKQISEMLLKGLVV